MPQNISESVIILQINFVVFQGLHETLHSCIVVWIALPGHNDKKTLQGNIRKSVEKGSFVMTEELKGYIGLDKDYNHLTVKYSAGEYFCPISGASTNDLESVWALMKRGYKGVYHHWRKKHLHRYIDEFSFRLDKGNCAIDTIDRVRSLVQGSVNKRLTYDELVGSNPFSFKSPEV